MTRFVAVCVCMLFVTAEMASAQSGTTGASANSVSTARATAGSSARPSFSGTTSASHRVRIRIRPHIRLVGAGSHVIRDNTTGTERSVDAVRLYTNLANSKVILSDVGPSVGVALRQESGSALFATRGFNSDAEQNEPGILFLVERETAAGGNRYITVTDL